MLMTEPFFDSNVVLYMLSTEAAKADRSAALLAAGGIISVQVLNECFSVARRKLKYSLPEIDSFLKLVRANCQVLPVTVEGHDLGRKVHERFGLQIYDSMIVAAAQLSGCAVLYSEDMHNGLNIGGLTICNPYK